MPIPTGVSRRIQQCLERYQFGDYEGALVNLFPAIDKTAKRRREKDGVGSRIKAFLHDEELLISAIGTGNIIRDCVFDGLTFHDAIYRFGRTSIAHEGELDPRLTFNKNSGLKIGQEWNLPSTYILGMSVAVVIAPENSGERTEGDMEFNIFGKTFALNDIWGNPTPVQAHICEIFQDPNLF